MAVCENCKKNEASVCCLLCRRNLCGACFEEHSLEISSGMDEGFASSETEELAEDQTVVCEVCGLRVESGKEDEHLFEAHGVSV